jgi:two-component system sensor histidine kinase RegB
MRIDVPITSTIVCAENSKILTGCSLRQALLNLVCNAADASPDGIEVVLRCAQEDVAIEVLDRGPGIPPDVRDKLGRTVYTSKPGMRGNGLGVFLATKTIERMGGRLEFFARDGGGTCARVTLPTADAALWR